MKKFFLYIQNRQTGIATVLLFLVSIATVVYISPREAKFKYEFTKGKPWLYDNLTAPFDFAIYKSETALREERQQVRENRTLFLQKDAAVAEEALVNFEEALERKWQRVENQGDDAKTKKAVPLTPEQKREWQNRGRDLLGELYQTGILQPFEAGNGANPLLLTAGGVSQRVSLSEFLTIGEASQRIKTEFKGDTIGFIRPILQENLSHNVFFDDRRTQSFLQTKLDEVLPTRGRVEKGELIILRGNIVDEGRFAKLESLRRSYEGRPISEFSIWLVLVGQILQIGILFLVLYVFLVQFRVQLTQDISRLTFILVNVLFVVLLTRVVLQFGIDFIYLVPFAILPITLRSFFDTRLAIFVHTIAILLCALMVPNSFEFIYLQFVAGVFSVVLVSNLYKRSQLFLTAAKIILVYCISYFSIVIIQEGSLQQIDWLNFGLFAGNGFLTLMSFPLIYFQEKIFGMVSDVSLLELSDTNNPLLRELAQKAPGTFQHSLQVANLAEAAVLRVGGNALLVRTGALYHDIGKMDNPMYFIENQSTGLNPHDELSFEESAEIIINHVRSGIKKAKKQNLPDMLVDFIRTHHGTTTVMYFYKQFIKNFPEEEVDLAKFTYPGPKPFSKETATLMMADSVEAASRSLQKPDVQKIDQLVEGIINHQMNTQQFENATITLREIKEIKKIFKKMLTNIYHVRVQYPE